MCGLGRVLLVTDKQAREQRVLQTMMQIPPMLPTHRELWHEVFPAQETCVRQKHPGTKSSLCGTTACDDSHTVSSYWPARKSSDPDYV